MDVRKAVFRGAAILVLGAVSVPAFAAAGAPRFGVYAGSEKIVYKENRNGGERKDAGNNVLIGVTYDNLLTEEGDLFHSLAAEYYSGKVKTNDQDGNELFKTKYSGFRLEGLGGSRIGNNVALDLIGGAFLDFGKRKADVESSPFTEKQRVIAVRLGLGFFHHIGAFRYRVSAGANFPAYAKFSVSNYSSTSDDFEYSPPAAVSPFVKVQANIGLGGTKAIQVNAYYDTLKFKQSSDIETIGQAWSKKEYSRVGLQAAYYF